MRLEAGVLRDLIFQTFCERRNNGELAQIHIDDPNREIFYRE